MSGIVEAIAKDLKIDGMENSLTRKEYRSAVLYSAAAMWAKAATQDAGDFVSGSRKHVLSVCNEFLSKVLEGESDEIKNYFYRNVEKKKTPGGSIVNALIRTRELFEVGSDPDNLVLSPMDEHYIQVDDGIQAVQGYLGTEKDFITASGLSLICEENDEHPLKCIDNKLWVESELVRIHKSESTCVSPSSGDHYFDVEEYGNKLFTRELPHDDYPFEIVMNDTNYEKRYYLTIGGRRYAFDNLSVKLKDHYRFMYYLMSLKGKKPYSLLTKGNVIHLRGKLALPIYEDSLIRAVMWPSRSVDDAAWFFGPDILLPFVTKVLHGLDVEL